MLIRGWAIGVPTQTQEHKLPPLPPSLLPLPLKTGGMVSFAGGGSEMAAGGAAFRSWTKLSGNIPRTPFSVPSHHPSSTWDGDAVIKIEN